MKSKLGVALGIAVLGVLLSGLGFGWRARVRRMEVDRRRIELKRQRQDFALRPGRDWPTVRGGLDMSGWTDEVLQPPLRKVWETKLPGDETFWVSDPIVYDGRVYVTRDIRGGGSGLHALDASDGRLLWTGSPVAEKPVDAVSPPTAGCGIICYAALRTSDNLTTVGHVYAFSALSGSLKWTREFRDAHRIAQIPIPPVIVRSGLVYYVRMNPEHWGTVAETWEIVARKVEDGALVSSRRFAGSPVHLGPFADGTLYVTSYVSGVLSLEYPERRDPNREESTLTALDARTGRLLWNSRFPKLNFNAATVSVIEACGRKGLLFGICDGSVIAFDTQTRRWLWHYELSELGYVVPITVAGNLVISGKALYGSKDYQGLFTAFEGVSRKQVWKRELSPSRWGQSELNGGPGAPVVTGDILYAFGENHTVAAIVQTGEVIWDCYDEYCQGGGFINVAVSKGRIFYRADNLVRSLEGTQYQGAH